MPTVPGLSPFDVAELKRVRAKLDGIKVGDGLECHNTPAGIRINLALKRRGNAPAAPSVFLFVPAANAHCGGVYTGQIYDLSGDEFDVDENDTFALADLGTAGVDAIGMNLREQGKDTHDVEFTGFLPKAFLALYRSTNPDGKIVVLFDGLQWEDCGTPT